MPHKCPHSMSRRTTRAASTILMASLAAAAACPAWAEPAPFLLAHNGKTDYVIVLPSAPSEVDAYAVGKLREYLKQMTGAEFPEAALGAMPARRPAIFVGMSAPALKRLGEDPLADLKPQEHVARSMGRDVFLYGQGVHGNLNAVMMFLEDVLGWRWYSVFCKPVVPHRPTLSLKPFRLRRGFSFAYREVGLRYNFDFYYQHGINMGFDRLIRKRMKRGGKNQPEFVSRLRNDKFVHASFAYIPPSPKSRYAKSFDWLEHKNYFETHPDFFSVDSGGRRVSNRQLCFSNPALRKELTNNILKHIEVSPDNAIITLDAADHPGKFCYCPGCQALEKKYQSPGGPIYDYLVELCRALKAAHPRVMVKTLAYRRSQTQKPPALPAGQKLPDNLIVSFAPIEDCYFADWTHPDPRIQETYRDLVAWRKVAAHLWAWLYPNPWGTGAVMPVGNVQRIITNMRLMHQAGVSGVFTDHNGFLERAGWSELQSYLLYKLMQDVQCDTDAIIQEFTDYMYAAAGPLVRQYLAELEQGRKAMAALPPQVRYKSSEYDLRTFPYLTVENICRWQTLFDAMERRVAGQADPLLNVRTLRRELDFATLWRWFDLKKRYPAYFRDYRPFADRIEAVNQAKAPAGMKPRPLGKRALADFIAIIQGGGMEKPLPAQFDGIDRPRIRTFLPANKGRGKGPRCVADPDAARGYAVTVDRPDMPFQFGFYQWKSRNPSSGAHGPRVSLSSDDITPGVYRLYKLGTITVSPDCVIWFSAKSWLTNLSLGDRLYEPGGDNTWTAYVSLKFEGPAYAGAEKNDRVLVDRIILVRQ